MLDTITAYALSPEGCTGICIQCDPAQKDEISSAFTSLLQRQWADIQAEGSGEPDYEDEFGQDIPLPVAIHLTDYGFYATVSLAFIDWREPRRFDAADLTYAIEDALDILTTAYPEVSYRGSICLTFYEALATTVIRQTIPSYGSGLSKHDTYDFIGDKLRDATSGIAFWEQSLSLLHNADPADIANFIRTMLLYRNYISDEALEWMHFAADNVALEEDDEWRPLSEL